MLCFTLTGSEFCAGQRLTNPPQDTAFFNAPNDRHHPGFVVLAMLLNVAKKCQMIPEEKK
jgi:hypothetical protein